MKSIRFSDSHNKFVAFGCDTFAYLTDKKDTFWTGCVSYCNNMSLVTNGTWSGIGCCETRVPKGVRDFRVELTIFHNHTNCWKFSPYSYALLADSSFSFNASDFLTFKNVTMMPVTLEWAVGNKTREEAREEKGFACVDVHSECYNSTDGPGYRCNCSRGYQGNPYLEGGCEEIMSD
ncbi:putative Wall-associated receptor kinase 2 [Cocos nucifera]|nr:putative Wall-associated receptor kinase 2 [Cocos nucifera]